MFYPSQSSCNSSSFCGFTKENKQQIKIFLESIRQSLMTEQLISIHIEEISDRNTDYDSSIEDFSE